MISKQEMFEKIVLKSTQSEEQATTFFNFIHFKFRQNFEKSLNKLKTWVSMFRPRRWPCYQNILILFCFGTACGTIIFSVVTETTIFCSLGRQYSKLLSISFLDVCGPCNIIKSNQFSQR
jgi:hypothetical protein